MVVRICPRCNQRYIVEENTIDFIHICKTSNPTLDQEDVVVMGKWEDFTGSDFNIHAAEVNMQGAENKLFGTRGWIEGEDVEDRTARGRRASTRRQRQHLSFIKLEGGEK